MKNLNRPFDSRHGFSRGPLLSASTSLSMVSLSNQIPPYGSLRGATGSACGAPYGDRLAVRLPVRLKNEQGAALILVMVMLVMLTFIGLAALSTSSTELFLSGNYRQSREAFQMADGLTEAALMDKTNFLPPATGVAAPPTPLTAGTLGATGSTATAHGTITYVTTGPTPAGSGMTVVMGSSVKANYFIIDTTGIGSLGQQSNQQLIMSEIVPGG